MHVITVIAWAAHLFLNDTKVFLMGHPKFLWKNFRLMKLALFLPSDFLKTLSDIVPVRQTIVRKLKAPFLKTR